MSTARYSAEALADLLAIGHYIARDSLTAAEQFVDRLQHVCDRLARSPGMGRQRPEIDPALRSFAVGNYVIFYSPESRGISVIRILHGSRDMPAEFDLS